MRLYMVALGTLACALAGQGRAAVANASISVSATVAGTCTITGTTLAFGTYTVATVATQQSALSVNCTAGTGYVVELDGNARHMTGPDGQTLPYEIYRDSSHSQRWGAGSSAQMGTGTGSTQALPIYAAIPPTSAKAGTYNDTVTVTLTY